MPVITRSRWHALWPYLDRAIDLPPERRRGFVDDLRVVDSSLADDLQSLLDQDEAIGRDGFLDSALIDKPAPSLAGQRVGAYTLISQIGRGGMGTVWLAERSDGRFVGHVAIKLLNLGLIGRDAEARFTREGTILARLTHAHVAHLVDAGVSPMGQPYLALEYVEGTHIDEYCKQHALGLEARLRLFLDVLDAVAHAHANLIVHRDIKPSNVLVRNDGHVKLLDFGIAKLIDENDSVGMTTAEHPRTPAYAAPEQVLGAPITTATDIFSLGVLLYVLLGGSRPTAARGQSAAEMFETEPARLSDAALNGKALRGDLANIVAKALKQAPGARYPSACAFADDLRRYLRHEPVSARPDTIAYRTTRFVRRRAGAVAGTAGVALLMASLAGFYTARLESERDRARLEAQKSAKVSELLTSLLTGADPYASRDREPTVRNILDSGAERVTKELEDQPALKAEMMTVIGRVYQRLGLFDKARPLLEQAAAFGRAGREDSVQLAQSLNDLGVLRRERGELQEATTLLEDALAMRRRLLGTVDKDAAVTLVELGRAYEDSGRDNLAEPLFREALAIREKVLGDAHRETSTSKSALALLLWRRGDLAEAEPLFRQSLATSRAVLPEDHPNVGSGLNNLGLVLLDKGDYIGAEPMFRESLAIKRKHFGDSHPSLGPSLSNLAASLREQGNLDEARSLLEEALAVTRRSLGENHQSFAGFEVNLAKVHLAQGDPVAAERLLRDAQQRQAQTSSESDWRLAVTRSLLGASLMEQGDYREAEPLLLEASRVLKDVPGRQGREAAATRLRLTTLYKVIGQQNAGRAFQARRAVSRVPAG
jgi:eukaryotic-like serine/threonine-protein kinase